MYPKPRPFPPAAGPCAGKTELFYPDERGRTEAIKVKEAVSLCRKCKSREECLTYALHYEPLGIWGATTPAERDAIRRRHNIVLSGVGVR